MVVRSVVVLIRVPRYYDPAKLDRAWSHLLAARNALGDLETYRNDLVEITRQVLGDYSFLVYNQMITAFNNSRSSDFAKWSGEFLEIFADMDEILGTQPSYLLGRWTQRAELWGVTPQESAQASKEKRTRARESDECFVVSCDEAVCCR